MPKNKKVFLGGTCNETTWRDEIIPYLEIQYFDPRVEDWTPDCMKEEIRQRNICDYVLYVITPKMSGVYSIAEVVDDSNKQPEKTVFCILKNDNDDNDNIISFDKGQYKSLEQVAKMVEENGAKVCKNLKEVIDYLNK